MKSIKFQLLLLAMCASASAFVAPATSVANTGKTFTAMQMADVSTLADVAHGVSTFHSTSGLVLAETEAWVQPTALVLGPFLNFLSFAMLCRVVSSWYPETDLNKVPWNIVAWPTEPFLRIVKGSIPPAFGVDVTPVFWLAVFTFINEILLGQQGLLVMKMKYGI